MKELTRFLGYLLSAIILFYSGAFSYWVELNLENPFMNLLWIPLFCIGCWLNLYFTKYKNKELKNEIK